jgi:hypothetical protein
MGLSREPGSDDFGELLDRCRVDALVDRIDTQHIQPNGALAGGSYLGLPLTRGDGKPSESPALGRVLEYSARGPRNASSASFVALSSGRG